MVSPQGYSYGNDPKSTNPFWDANGTTGVESVKAEASVDNTTGTPSVTVSNVGTDADVNLKFSFSGIKGEQGERGPKGDTGATPDIRAEASVDNTTGTPSVTVSNVGTDADVNLKFSFSGIKGEQGPKGDTGATPDISNVVAEVVDSVSENETDGYDKHTIRETEYNGTQNDVGNFVIAKKQITAINSDGTYKTVDQTGKVETNRLPGINVNHAIGIPQFADQAKRFWADGMIIPVYGDAYNNKVLSFPHRDSGYNIAGTLSKEYEATAKPTLKIYIKVGKMILIDGRELAPSYTQGSFSAFEPAYTEPVILDDIATVPSGSKKIRLGENGKMYDGNNITGLGASLMYFDLSIEYKYENGTLTVTPKNIEYLAPGYIMLLNQITMEGTLE